MSTNTTKAPTVTLDNGTVLSNAFTTDSGVVVVGPPVNAIQSAEKAVEAAEERVDTIAQEIRELEEEATDPDAKKAFLASATVEWLRSDNGRLARAHRAAESASDRLQRARSASPGVAPLAAEALLGLISQYPEVQAFAVTAQEPAGLPSPRLVITNEGPNSITHAEMISIRLVLPAYFQPLDPAEVQAALGAGGFGFGAKNVGSPLQDPNRDIEHPTEFVQRGPSELVQAFSWSSGVRYQSPKKKAKAA